MFFVVACRRFSHHICAVAVRKFWCYEFFTKFSWGEGGYQLHNLKPSKRLLVRSLPKDFSLPTCMALLCSTSFWYRALFQSLIFFCNFVRWWRQLRSLPPLITFTMQIQEVSLGEVVTCGTEDKQRRAVPDEGFWDLTSLAILSIFWHTASDQNTGGLGTCR